MVEDFHYYCVAVLARAAGLPKADALTLAYASQYVDDATESKPIHVGGDLFDPARTAHMGLKTFDWSIQKRVYLPFHFLPEKPFDPHRNQFVTRPGSPFAKMLLEAAAAEKDKRMRLIRTGIALHTYADTWAHQGFSGRHHVENGVRHLEVLRDDAWHKDFLASLIRTGPRIGHLKAGYFPDQPFARWRYVNALTGEAIERDNPAIYLDAAKAIYDYLRGYSKKPGEAVVAWKDLSGVLFDIFTNARFRIGERCEVWRDTFGYLFEPRKFKYNKYRWRARALGVKKSETHWDDKPARIYFRSHTFPYNDGFFNSDWVAFHKAALKQRHLVLENLL